MKDEKFLVEGEPGIEVNALPMLHSYAPDKKTPTPSDVSAPVAQDKKSVPENLPGVPSQKQQQWGVVISIAIIVLMIIIGAFYAWGQRIAQNQIFTEPATAQ